MFRKPKSKNVNQRRAIDEEDGGAETSKVLEPQETPITVKVQTQRTNSSVLTFGEEEESDEFVGAASSFGVASNIRSVHKIRKKRKDRKHSQESTENEELPPASNGQNQNAENYRLDLETTRLHNKRAEVRKDNGDSRHSSYRPNSTSPTASGEDDRRHHTNASSSLDDADDQDTRARFPSSFSDIPDAKAVFEARKKREMLRATGGAVQPVIPLASEETRLEDTRGSRLVREDDERDLSDEEYNNVITDSRFITTKNLLIDIEQQRREELLAALKLEQGGSDSEEDRQSVECLDDDEFNKKTKKKSKKMKYRKSDGTLIEGHSGSDDDEMERWEREQIRKAVGQRKVVEIHEEVKAYRRAYDNPQSLVNVDRLIDEDMDIEVVPQQNSHIVPAFFNSADGSLKRQHKYENMQQLIEKLESSILSRREEIKTKHHQIEQYEKHVEENRESILKLADANIQLERNLHLYQSQKFSTENVMNCLNEKLPLINDIESEIFDLWRTRAANLKRMRVEEKNRRRFERHYSKSSGWNSDDEELRRPDSYNEAMTRLMERATAVFDDTATEYFDVAHILSQLLIWFQINPESFRDAYVAECIPKFIGPYVRIQLFEWNPLHVQNRELSSFDWYQAVLRIGFNNEGVEVEDPTIVGIIPDIVEKVVVPKLIKIVNELWDPMSVGETQRLVEQIDRFVQQYPSLNSESKFFLKLLNAIRGRIQEELKNETQVPEHLHSLVTEIRREPKRQEYEGVDDMQALLAQSKSILK